MGVRSLARCWETAPFIRVVPGWLRSYSPVASICGLTAWVFGFRSDLLFLESLTRELQCPAVLRNRANDLVRCT